MKTKKANNARVYLWSTIYDRLLSEGVKSHEIDIRYLNRWITKYPKHFPKFMINNFFTPIFNSSKYRWEIIKGYKEIKFNPNNYAR